MHWYGENAAGRIHFGESFRLQRWVAVRTNRLVNPWCAVLLSCHWRSSMVEPDWVAGVLHPHSRQNLERDELHIYRHAAFSEPELLI